MQKALANKDIRENFTLRRLEQLIREKGVDGVCWTEEAGEYWAYDRKGSSVGCFFVDRNNKLPLNEAVATFFGGEKR